MTEFWNDLPAFSDDIPLPQFPVVRHPERVVFDRLEATGAQREAEHRYVNHTADLAVGQCTYGWSFGVCRLAVRLLTPCGLRRLGLTQRFVVDALGRTVVPAAEDVPIRVILPRGILWVGGKEYHFEKDLPTGTEVRLKVDLDKMALQLRIDDWDSGTINIDPQTIPSPLYPYFLIDSGDSFEVLPY